MEKVWRNDETCTIFNPGPLIINVKDFIILSSHKFSTINSKSTLSLSQMSHFGINLTISSSLSPRLVKRPTVRRDEHPVR